MSRSVPARKSVDDHFNWPCNMTWNHETLQNGDWNDGPSVTIVIVNQECFTSKAMKQSSPGCPAKGPWCTCGWRSMFSGRCPSAGKLESWRAGELADARLDFDVFLLQDPTPFVLGEAQRRPFGQENMCKVILKGFVKLRSFADIWLLTSANKVGLVINKSHLYKHVLDAQDWFLLQTPIIVGLHSGAQRLIQVFAHSKLSDWTAGFHFWFYGRVTRCLYREDRYHRLVILAVLMELQMANAGSLRGWRWITVNFQFFAQRE